MAFSPGRDFARTRRCHSLNLTTKILLWLMLLLPVSPAMVKAQLMLETNNGSIMITGFTGGGNVVIPATTNGYEVTSIGISAFSFCTSLSSITIPGTVTNIGIDAFNDCSSLTNVVLSDGIVSIGDLAFGFCGLISVTIPDSVTNI